MAYELQWQGGLAVSNKILLANAEEVPIVGGWEIVHEAGGKTKMVYNGPTYVVSKEVAAALLTGPNHRWHAMNEETAKLTSMTVGAPALWITVNE